MAVRPRAGRLFAALLAPLAVACSTGGSDGGVTPEPIGSLSSALSTSAAKANVPRDLLVAIAKVEDGLTLPAERPDIDVDNEVPAAGPLQLRRGKLDSLRRGAELAGVTELDLRMHGDLALSAGALVLAELGQKTQARTDDLASWRDAIEEMSGFADEAHREHYSHQVFATLARGGRFESRDGEIVVLPPRDLPPSLTLDVSHKIRALAQAQYAGAEWIPTSCNDKCTPGRGGFKVELIVIHDTEGGWNASVATLQNDPDKSVQYIVDVNGRVAQFVTEETTAWHAGNFNVNQRSVGIEHVGYAKKPFAEAEYAASAKLVDYLATKYSVPRNRSHIIGHDQIPNGAKIAQNAAPCSGSPKECQANTSYGGASHHTDPGVWEWPTFMARFNGEAKCNDAPAQATCSNDKTKSFHCESGKVIVETCEGTCEVKDGDAPDVCVAVAAQQPAAAPVAEAPAAEPPEPAEPPPQDDGGCAVTRGRRAGSSYLVVVLGGLVVLGRRRRRPRAD